MQQTLTALILRASDNLKNSKEALYYLHKRGVTEPLYSLHNVGFYPVLPRVKEKSEIHRKFNIWRSHAPEHTLIFPLYNFEGKIIGIQTRSIVTKHYDSFVIKEDIPVFFGLPTSLQSAYEKGWVFLTEGVFDYFAIKLHIPNVLSSLTIKVSTKHAKHLKRFVDAVVIGSDNDMKDTADKQIQETIRTFQNQNLYTLRVVPFHKDWNEYLEKSQNSALKSIILETSEQMCFYMEGR
jgi:DNA primase